nr:hypothetical protein CFP56_47712 [Quercus suber]
MRTLITAWHYNMKEVELCIIVQKQKKACKRMHAIQIPKKQNFNSYSKRKAYLVWTLQLFNSYKPLLARRVLINKTPRNTNLLPKTTRNYPKLENFERKVHRI